MRAVLDTNVVMSAIFFGGVPLKIIRAAILTMMLLFLVRLEGGLR